MLYCYVFSFNFLCLLATQSEHSHIIIIVRLLCHDGRENNNVITSRCHSVIDNVINFYRLLCDVVIVSRDNADSVNIKLSL